MTLENNLLKLHERHAGSLPAVNSLSTINDHLANRTLISLLEDVQQNYTVQQKTFKGENFRGSVRSDHFAEKTIVEC